jgi:hypothetical protein
MYFASCGFELCLNLEERRELAKAAARAGASVQAAPEASGRRQKPVSAAAQTTARDCSRSPLLRLVEAMHVPMLARRVQLELRAAPSTAGRR